MCRPPSRTHENRISVRAPWNQFSQSLPGVLPLTLHYLLTNMDLNKLSEEEKNKLPTWSECAELRTSVLNRPRQKGVLDGVKNLKFLTVAILVAVVEEPHVNEAGERKLHCGWETCGGPSNST